MTERRLSTSQQTRETSQYLDVSIEGTLKKADSGSEDRINAIFRIDHICLAMSSQAEPDSMLRYDSKVDKPGQGNRLADLMATVADARLTLQIGPSGQLLELRGLDPRWRAAGIVVAPPDLLAAQWQFRDMSMADLVAEALFPPVPDGELRNGDKFTFDLPVNIPLVAQFTSRLSGVLSTVCPDRPGQYGEGDAPASSAIVVSATGDIQPAAPALAGVPPAISPTVRKARHHRELTLDPQNRSLSLEDDRVLETTVTLAPPHGSKQLEMTLHQTRSLKARRG